MESEKQGEKRTHEEMEEGDTKVTMIPPVLTRNYTDDEKKVKLICIGGRWVEYGELDGKIALIYKDSTTVVVVKKISTTLVEKDVRVVECVYQQLLNLFHDQLDHTVRVFGDKRIIPGKFHADFCNLLFFACKHNANAIEMHISYPHQNNISDNKVKIFGNFNHPYDLFLYALCEHVNDHCKRLRAEKKSKVASVSGSSDDDDDDDDDTDTSAGSYSDE